MNAAAPVAAYQILTGAGMSTTQALTISAVFPLIGTGAALARTRRADVIGLVSLVFIVAGLAASIISGNPRFLLVKESLLTGVFGLVFLGSLLAPRPLIFYFGRQFTGAGDPARAAAFDAMWQYPRFRAANRTMSIVWGVTYLIEACVRVGLSFILPTTLFLAASPVLAIGTTLALISWTVAYGRRAARQREAQITP